MPTAIRATCLGAVLWLMSGCGLLSLLGDAGLEHHPAGLDPSGTIQADAGSVRPDFDVACDTVSDCEVKNVGNCCGYYPRCVNVGFTPDPTAVLRWCEQAGASSVCGWPEITQCLCVEHRCKSMHGDQGV